MKKLQKKLGILAIAGVLTMCGCSSDNSSRSEEEFQEAVRQEVEKQLQEKAADEQTEETAEESDTAGESAQQKEESADGQTEQTQTAPEEQAQEEQKQEELLAAQTRHYYAGVLSGMVYGRQWPDGTPVDDSFGEVSENDYAIQDVDGDGKEELLLFYTNAPTAGMTAYVYGYDAQTRTLHEELCEFPSLTFYENGAIKANWSHNQGLGAELYPYTMYEYNSSTDTYQSAGSVDSWEKSFAPQDYQGNAFPDELDTDGDGILYYINQSGEYSTDHPVTRSEYEAWVQSCVGDGKELEFLTKTMDYTNFETYTDEYLKLLLDQAKESGGSAENDMGVFYMEQDGDLEKLEQKITSQYQVSIGEGEYDLEHVASVDGTAVVSFYYEDGGTVVYQNKKLEDMTLFGLYPGISVQQAATALEKYGFYQDSDCFYITGTGIGNYGVYLDVENETVTGIRLYGYCKYVG